MNGVGNIEWRSLENAKAMVYTPERLPPFQNPQNEIELLNVFRHNVGVFLSSLWLVKDNAVGFELGLPPGQNALRIASARRIGAADSKAANMTGFGSATATPRSRR